MIVEDPVGRRTGSVSSIGSFHEIPKAMLEYSGPGETWISRDSSEVDWSETGVTFEMYNPIDGTYRITLHSDTTAILDMWSSVNRLGAESHVSSSRLAVRSGQTVLFRFQYTSAYPDTIILTKAVGWDLLDFDVDALSIFFQDNLAEGQQLWTMFTHARQHAIAREADSARAVLGSLKSAIGGYLGGVILDTAYVSMVSQDIELLSENMPMPKSKHRVPSDYPSVQRAIDVSLPGDTVEVSTGAYDEVVKIASKSNLRLLGNGNPGTIRLRGLRILKCRDIAVGNLLIDGRGGPRSVIEVLGDSAASSEIVVERCEIKNAGKGFHGIYVGTGTARLRIANNSIHSNGGHGICVNGGIRCHYVLNNTVVRNAGSGILIGAVDTAYAVNNIICFNGTGGQGGIPRCGVTTAWDHDPLTIVLLNNVIVGNPTDIGNASYILDHQQQTALDEGNLTTNGNEGWGVAASSTSAFSSIFNSASGQYLRLSSNSIAIKRGMSWYNRPDLELGAVPIVDRDGTPRGGTGKVDCGCYESPKTEPSR